MLETEFNKKAEKQLSLEERLNEAYKIIEAKEIRETMWALWDHLTPEERRKKVQKQGAGKYGTDTIDRIIVDDVNYLFSVKKAEIEEEFRQRRIEGAKPKEQRLKEGLEKIQIEAKQEVVFWRWTKLSKRKQKQAIKKYGFGTYASLDVEQFVNDEITRRMEKFERDLNFELEDWKVTSNTVSTVKAETTIEKITENPNQKNDLSSKHKLQLLQMKIQELELQIKLEEEKEAS